MIIDTGVLFAALDIDEPAHEAVATLLTGPDRRIVPESVVVETDWLVQRRLGVEVEVRFLRSLDEGTLVVEPVTPADRRRAADVIEQYRDLRIGYVDATVVAMAERLRETRIATLDRRHFGVIRPRHVNAFELVP